MCPYHYELVEEEWLFVFAGTPTVRTPGGEEACRAGDIVCFARGPAARTRSSTPRTSRPAS